MPKVKVVSDLNQICLENVTKNMEKFWCKNYNQQLSQNQRQRGFFKYVIGPFEYLSSDSIQLLIDLLTQKKLFKRHHLDLLIHSRIEHLDLTECRQTANNDSVINMLSYRCMNMKRLNLSAMNQISPKSLKTLGSSLSNIQILDLSWTKLNDQALQSIAESCPYIKDLNIQGCPVQDSGLECLYSDINIVNLRHLIKLNLRDTWTSSRSVANIIRHLNNVKFLYHHDLDKAIWEVYQTEFLKAKNGCVDDSVKHCLQIFESSSPPPATPYGDKVCIFEIVVTFCPQITEVYLNYPPSNSELLTLSCLTLKVLHLANSKSVHNLITFEQGLGPLLQISGKNIQALEIEDVNGIDLNVIGLSCPLLRSLHIRYDSMSDVTYNDSIPINGNKIFQELRELFIYQGQATLSLTVKQLEQLLINCKFAQKVNLLHVDTLTDDVVSSVLQHHCFPHLSSLMLRCCNEISDDGIMALLEQNNELKKLDVRECWNVHRSHYDEAIQWIKNRSLDVTYCWD